MSAEPNDVGTVGEVAVVEGLRGQWRVDPAQLDRLGQPFRGRTALLSPLDRLVFDRKRMTELFEFDYQLEMYKPVAKRRWGYWALPILHGDRLVGKVDATADLRRGAAAGRRGARGRRRSPPRCARPSTARSPTSPPGWASPSPADGLGPRCRVSRAGATVHRRRAGAAARRRRRSEPRPRRRARRRARTPTAR